MQRKQTSGAARDRPLHYLPNQGLFDRDDALAFLTDDGHDENDQFEEDEETLSFYSTPNSRSQRSASSTPRSSSQSPLGESPFQNLQRGYCEHTQNASLDVIALLQEQQAMLQKVVKQQEAMQKQQQDILKKQKEFTDKVINLEDKVASSITSSESGFATVKEKTRITRQLTVSVRTFYFIVTVISLCSQNLVASVHDAMEEGFRPNERCSVFTLVRLCMYYRLYY